MKTKKSKKPLKTAKKPTTKRTETALESTETPKTVERTPAQTKATTEAIDRVRKLYGKEIIGTLVEKGKTTSCITTGHPELDDLLTGEQRSEHGSLFTVKGSGLGLPKGRIIEIFGPESSGKTTLTLEIIKGAQKAGLACAFVDAEHALDVKYAQKIGVDVESLFISQPSSAEETHNVVASLSKGGIDLIVVDSVAALVPEREMDEKKTPQPGAQAKLMSENLRKLIQYCDKSGCVVVYINQLRSKIGVMFGNPETTTGGRSLPFYASIRLDIRKTKTLKKGTKVSGIRSRIKAVKNKVAPPFREIYVEMVGGKGFSKIYSDSEEDEPTDDDED